MNDYEASTKALLGWIEDNTASLSDNSFNIHDEATVAKYTKQTEAYKSAKPAK